MVSLNEVVAFLDQGLQTAAISDYSGALNGLQLENGGRIGRVVVAVDASLPVIAKAAAGGPGLLIVHHGLFWHGVQPLAGPWYRKLKIAMDADLAIYSSHLPLDLHPHWGNNFLLAKAIGLTGLEPFLEDQTRKQPMGLRGTWNGSRESLVQAVSRAVGGAVHLCPGGGEQPSRVGIVTGAAGSEVMAASKAGVDTLITGEGPHWSYPLAEELGLNVLYGGHYATETHGVRELGRVLSGKFALPWAFIDHPTGL